MRILFFALALVMAFNASAYATPAQEDKMVAVILLMDNEDDKEVVATIYTTLMAAEKVAKLMDVELIASDDPVQDDVFVFALKSEEQKDLTMRMFDEEGFTNVAHNVLEVTEGSNYRALKVDNLEDGTYIFEVSDENGDSQRQTIEIKRD